MSTSTVQHPRPDGFDTREFEYLPKVAEHSILLQEYESSLGLTSDRASIEASNSEGYLDAALPAWALAAGSVAAMATAINRYCRARDLPEQRYELRAERIAASFTGDRVMRIDGEPISGFAELSGFFRTTDGWVRTHGNYPHHRSRLLAALDLPDDADRQSTAVRIGALTAADIEARAVAAGAIAVRVRNESEWSASEQGRAAAAGSLVGITTRIDRAPVAPADGAAPLAGIRVLDFTRVIAGPTATRALALLGADVLRIDPPQLLEIGWQHQENGQGKRSSLLDLRRAPDLAIARELIGTADVLVTGYRRGALERFSLDSAGIVHGRVNAWGDTGPWADRRGFDSIVQAASGISLIEGSGSPGALPAQALDHATGYLLAAGIIDALTARRTDGCGRDVATSLARTAASLLALPGRAREHAAATQPTSAALVTHGAVTVARPALAAYDDYPFPARPWGADEPAWQG